MAVGLSTSRWRKGGRPQLLKRKIYFKRRVGYQLEGHWLTVSFDTFGYTENIVLLIIGYL